MVNVLPTILILPPTHKFPDTLAPPSTRNAPVPMPVAIEVLVTCVTPLDNSVVKEPVLGVMLPIGVLLIAAAVVNPKLVLPCTVAEVNVAAAGVTLPITVLLMSCACSVRPTSKLLRIAVLPVVAAMVSVVAAPAKFTVVAVVLNTSCVVLVPTTVGLLMVSVPVVAPKSIAVASPNALTVVAVVSNRLNVVAVVVTSPPLTARSSVNVANPVTSSVPPTVALPTTSSNAFRTVNVPVVAPIVNVVAAPAKFNVVAVVLAKLNVVLVTTKFSPSIETLPSTSKLLLIFVVPVAAPNSNVVAEVNAFTVAAFAVSRLNVVAVVVKLPPLTAASPLKVRLAALMSPLVVILPTAAENSTVKLPICKLAKLEVDTVP